MVYVDVRRLRFDGQEYNQILRVFARTKKPDVRIVKFWAQMANCLGRKERDSQVALTYLATLKRYRVAARARSAVVAPQGKNKLARMMQ